MYTLNFASPIKDSHNNKAKHMHTCLQDYDLTLHTNTEKHYNITFKLK